MSEKTESTTLKSTSLGTAEPPSLSESSDKPKTSPPAKRGRPKKTEVAKKKQGNRGKVGRPKGDAAIMNEYKARMLNSPKSRRVLEAIFDAALDPEHKNQAAAWKLVMDRVAPTAMFEKEVVQGSGRSSIQINITGVGDTQISSGDTYENGETYEGELE